jgi:hypothetical protein
MLVKGRMAIEGLDGRGNVVAEAVSAAKPSIEIL